MAPEGLGESSPADASQQIEALVKSFLETITTARTGSSSFQRRMDDVNSLGQREIVAISQLSMRFFDRPNRDLERLFEETAPVGRSLLELRAAVQQLDPSRYKLAGDRKRRFAVFLHRTAPLRRYLERYAESEERIREMVAVLRDGRSQLERDNAAIHDETRSLATLADSLRRYAHLAERLDEAVAAALDGISSTDPARAQELRSEVLYQVRQRRQDILTHLAVSAQGLAGLSIVGKNNDQLIRAIQTAITTTVTALRTAVLVAHALTSHRLVAAQLKTAAELSAMVDASAAAFERDLGGAEGSLKIGAAGGVAQLQHAWDQVFAALDEVERNKRRAQQAVLALAPAESD
jgi:uncharacterized protein YaaN involved in tellurite resistance